MTGEWRRPQTVERPGLVAELSDGNGVGAVAPEAARCQAGRRQPDHQRACGSDRCPTSRAAECPSGSGEMPSGHGLVDRMAAERP